MPKLCISHSMCCSSWKTGFHFQIFSLSPEMSDRLWGPPSLQFNWHVSLSSDEVKKEWSYTFTPFICLHDVDRDTFNFFTCIVKFSALFGSL